MISEGLRAKLQKLLCMAERGTGNEAEVAMIKVRELMQTHGVTKDDVDLYTEKISAPIRKSKWLLTLLNVCGEFSGVVTLISRNYFMFAGDEIGVNVGRELFAYLKNEIARQLKNQKVKGQKLKNDFRLGCVFGLREKMSQIGGWRDMEIKRNEVSEKHFSKIKEKRSNKVTVEKAYYEAGLKKGADINISRQAAGVGSSVGLLEDTHD